MTQYDEKRIRDDPIRQPPSKQNLERNHENHDKSYYYSNQIIKEIPFPKSERYIRTNWQKIQKSKKSPKFQKIKKKILKSKKPSKNFKNSKTLRLQKVQKFQKGPKKDYIVATEAI